MPKGEFGPLKKTVRVFAMPSLSSLRSSVVRLALGTPPPARFVIRFITQPLGPQALSDRGAPLVSVTSTSPLGST